VNHLIYDSYGNLIVKTNPSIDSNYLYTGRELDEEIQLYYYRARYYNAKVGKFLSKDPIGLEEGGSNLYAYVSNNPVNTLDPLGLKGRLLNPQTRFISYSIPGVFINSGLSGTSFDIKEVNDLWLQYPNLLILNDRTTASIGYSSFDTGQEPNVSPRQIPGFIGGVDNRGHIVAKQLGGQGDINNLFAQQRDRNQQWKARFEDPVRRALDQLNTRGQRQCVVPPVTLSYEVNLTYEEGSLRPVEFFGTATFSNGSRISSQIFDNPTTSRIRRRRR